MQRSLKLRLLCGIWLLVLVWGPAAADGLTVAVVSDLNGSYGSEQYGQAVHNAVERLAAMGPDLVIISGDMVAGQRPQPRLRSGELDRMWAVFRRDVAGRLDKAGISLAATPGNHDASDYPGFEAERAAYRRAWAGREPAGMVDRGDYPFHYAFAKGHALFIALDATRKGPLDPAQRAWLEGVLARHGDEYRWRVVFGHLPLHPVNDYRRPEILNDPELEGLLARAGVDVYLSGHHHAFYPGQHGGLAQVSQACLGASPRPLTGTAGRSPRAITVLEFRTDGAWRVGALEGPDFRGWLDATALPPAIGDLVRLDRAGQPGVLVFPGTPLPR